MKQQDKKRKYPVCFPQARSNAEALFWFAEVRMKLLNFTPDPVTLRVTGNGINYGEGRDITIPSSGLARLETRDRPDGQGYLAADEPAGWPDGGNFNVVERKLGDIVGLPEPAERTIYIVSLPVAQRAADLGRNDVYAPDTISSAIRSENGQIVAVRGLVRFAPSPIAEVRQLASGRVYGEFDGQVALGAILDVIGR